MTGPVVVGLDDSPASVTAARWGAGEAAARHLPLVLLHSWTTQPLDVPVPQEGHAQEQYGRDLLQRTAAELLARHGELVLSTELVAASATQALLDSGRSASILVLGSRGHGSVASFLLGSVSMHVLGLTPCPAVAVRADAPDVEAGWGRPLIQDHDEVVVGLHESGAAAEPLLEFAFTTAASHGARVRAVRAMPLSSLVTDPREDFAAEERERLAEVLAPWREKFPDVPVVRAVATGAAAQVLLTACAHGCLTVVGRRRHPSHLTWKLGPVTHAALHHVACPVAVVPHD